MKAKKLLAWLIVFAMVATVMPSYSEAKTAIQGSKTIKFKNVTGSKKVMYVGSSFALKANVASSKLVFSSSKKNTAKVEEGGLITAKKAGTSVITVKNKMTKVTKKLTIKVKKATAYKISKTSGTYTDMQKIKVTAKKGYTVYYSTNGKFNAKRVIKPNKSKTFTVSKTTTLNLYPVKGTKKLTTAKLNKTKYTNGLCADYYFVIKKAEATNTPRVTQSPTSVPTPSATANPTPITPVDPTEDDYTVPTKVEYTAADLDTSEGDSCISINEIALDTNIKNDNFEISKKGKVTILKSGTYKITGNFASNINVEAADVHVILNGVTAVNNGEDAPLKIKKNINGYVVVTLAAGTVNTFTDTSPMVATGEKDEGGNDIYEVPDGAVACKKSETKGLYSTLTINGTGTLIANSTLGSGIKSNGGLKIVSGNIIIDAGNNGITGRRFLGIRGGTFNITSGSEGIKTTEPYIYYDAENNVIEDTDIQSYMDISGGDITINSNADGIQAYNTLFLAPNTLNIKCGAPAETAAPADPSYKGIKAATIMELASGTYDVDAADDCLQSDGSIYIKGGTFTLKSGDDAVHANNSLSITAGSINVTDSYEGLESADITIAGGTINIKSSDDGINGAGGKDGNAGKDIFGPGRPGGQPGDSTTNSKYQFLISGGDIIVDAAGDGVDINGDIYMTGGKLVVYGPADNSNAPIDYDNTFQLTGGTLLALGSVGMVQAPTETSSQPFVQMALASQQAANTAVAVKKGETSLISVNAKKVFQSVVFSSSELALGSTCSCTIGGQAYNFTLNSIKTTYGNMNQR